MSNISWSPITTPGVSWTLRSRLSHWPLEVGELFTVAFNDWTQQPRRRGYTHSSRIQRLFFLYPDPMWILWGMSFDFSIVGLCCNLMMESTIWGLSKQGKTCKACGLCVHTKCELKVKIPIPVPSRPKSGSRFRRTAQKAYLPSLLSLVRPRYHPASARPVRTNGTLVSAWILTLIAAPSSTTPSLSSSDLLQAPQEESHHTATVLFDFTPSSEFELSIRGKYV